MGEYELWQFHAHWGDANEKGSEHTVEGKMYPSELHLVHWNKSKYSSPNEAAGEPDGLAVLGIFLEVGEKHEELDKVFKLLDQIKFKGDKVSFAEPVEPSKFLPKDTKSLYTYEDSLTTPPLLESVIWTVFKEPVQISKEQLEAMRGMKLALKLARLCHGQQLPTAVCAWQQNPQTILRNQSHFQNFNIRHNIKYNAFWPGLPNMLLSQTRSRS